MARKKKEEEVKGGAGWMNTFADLMNLLLCFFVLLFSMSSVDAAKLEMIVSAMQSTFSVLPAGGSSIGDGQLISAGISQLENIAMYFEQGNTQSTEDSQEKEMEESTKELYEKESLSESEKMSEAISKEVERNGIQSQVEVDFNAEYVLLTLNGALLFDSGKSELRTDAYPLIDKVGAILSSYESNILEIEGHTDNVPISNTKYPDNNVLSMYRALEVTEYIRSITDLNPALLKSSGRGEYVPVADNATPEGRARNRRVEIKIYNSYNSQN